MEKSGLLIDRLRLDAMFTFVYGFRSNWRKRTLLTNYRFRHTKRWSDAERKQAAELFDKIGKRKRRFQDTEQDVDDYISGKLQTKNFTAGTIKNYKADFLFCDEQMHVISRLFGITSNQISNLSQNTSHNDACHSSTEKVLQFEPNNALETKTTAQLIKSAKLKKQNDSNQNSSISATSNNPSRKRNRDGEFLDLRQSILTYLAQRNLNCSQQKVVNKMLAYFYHLKLHKTATCYRAINPLCTMNAVTNIPAPELLVTGDPGSGKSYVTETICDLVNIMGLGSVATCSYNGIAAVNVDGATICSLFSVTNTDRGPPYNLSSTTELEDLRKRLDWENIACLIVDEVSTVDTRTVALMHYRMQEVMENEQLPFGGVPIIFVGDFNQLGPVKKDIIPLHMMRWALRQRQNKPTMENHAISFPHHRNHDRNGPAISNLQAVKQKIQMAFNPKTKKQKDKEEADAFRFQPGSLYYLGCVLFSKLERFHLREQQRASEDEKHNQLVQKMSSGKPLELKDLKNYKHLSKQDIKQNPAEWKYAPIIVSTNKERFNASRLKSALWAQEHKSYVFRWRSRVHEEKNRPPMDKLQPILEENAFFWQYFTPGAPAYLSQNINCDVALVNGSPITLHSLTFEDIHEYNRIMDIIEGPHPPPFGSEIEIEEPTSVNVTITPSLDSKPISSKRQKQLDMLKTFSITPSSGNDNIVLPITTNMIKYSRDNFKKFSYFSHHPITPIATAEIMEPFPFDLAFSITAHKAQGRTIHRVIIDLTYHHTHYSRMCFASIFVAMSRVRQSDHIRFL